VGGALSVASAAGPNGVPFGGRFGKKALKPGRYEATVVATDAAGRRRRRRRLASGSSALRRTL
jgi:hypothetical protein